MGCGKLGRDAEPLAEICHDLRGKLRALITNDGVRKTMIFPDVEEVEFGGVQSCGGLIAQNELGFFGESVDNCENRVEAVGKGKVRDEIRTDVHPRHRAWL